MALDLNDDMRQEERERASLSDAARRARGVSRGMESEEVASDFGITELSQDLKRSASVLEEQGKELAGALRDVGQMKEELAELAGKVDSVVKFFSNQQEAVRMSIYAASNYLVEEELEAAKGQLDATVSQVGEVCSAARGQIDALAKEAAAREAELRSPSKGDRFFSLVGKIATAAAAFWLVAKVLTGGLIG